MQDFNGQQLRTNPEHVKQQTKNNINESGKHAQIENNTCLFNIWAAAETPLEQCYSRGGSTEGGLRRTLWLPALPRSIFIKNWSTEGLRRGSTEAPSQKLSRRDPPEGTLNWLSSTEGVYGVYIYIYSSSDTISETLP